MTIEFQVVGISLALGLLVGVQRQHAESSIAGLRTFPMITLAGTLAALLDRLHDAHGWILAAGGVSVVSLVVSRNLALLKSDVPRDGMTTESAILLMFGVGAYLVAGERMLAVAVGVMIAVMLQFKPELHGIVERLGDMDLKAIMQFALFTCVILPVLPNDTYGPFDVINPFEVWLMVVLIVGISLGGYIIYKFFGENAGMLLGGLLGGAISSTATTVSYSRRTASDPDNARLASVVIMIASSIVFGRVLIEISIVAPSHVAELGFPVGVMFATSFLTALAVWVQARGQSDAMPEQSNPTEVKSAVIFGLLYAGVLLALAAAMEYLGDRGAYAVAVVSGLTDMDAITLSTARLVEDQGMATLDGWRLIVVASMSNLVFKLVIAAVIGNAVLLRRIGILFAVPLLTGVALLFLWV